MACGAPLNTLLSIVNHDVICAYNPVLNSPFCYDMRIGYWKLYLVDYTIHIDQICKKENCRICNLYLHGRTEGVSDKSASCIFV